MWRWLWWWKRVGRINLGWFDTGMKRMGVFYSSCVPRLIPSSVVVVLTNMNSLDGLGSVDDCDCCYHWHWY